MLSAFWARSRRGKCKLISTRSANRAAEPCSKKRPDLHVVSDGSGALVAPLFACWAMRQSPLFEFLRGSLRGHRFVSNFLVFPSAEFHSGRADVHAVRPRFACPDCLAQLVKLYLALFLPFHRSGCCRGELH